MAEKRDTSATLRDVAAGAGVNVSTASRALRRDPRITEATRRRVEEAARIVGYRPNPYVAAFAAQMRSRHSAPARATIAVLETEMAGDASVPWFRRYFDGIAAAAASQGFAIDRLRLGDPGLESVAKIGRVLRARGIRGLVIMPARVSLRGIPFDSLAAATIDLSLRWPAIHRATPDYFQGMQLALDHLHAMGRRRIGFCSTRSEVARIGERWLGGHLAWQRMHPRLPRIEPHFGEAPRNLPTAEAMAAQWRCMRDDFSRWLDRERPDAIISNLAYIPAWLRELGVRVPGEVLFASLGLDEGDQAPGIDQRSERVGAAAVEIVSSQIYRNDYGPPDVPTTVFVPGIWRDPRG